MVNISNWIYVVNDIANGKIKIPQPTQSTQQPVQQTTGWMPTQVEWITQVDVSKAPSNLPDPAKYMTKQQVFEKLQKGKELGYDPKVVLKDMIAKWYTLEWYDQIKRQQTQEQVKWHQENLEYATHEFLNWIFMILVIGVCLFYSLQLLYYKGIIYIIYGDKKHHA